jgi:hypothetical protein
MGTITARRMRFLLAALVAVLIMLLIVPVELPSWLIRRFRNRRGTRMSAMSKDGTLLKYRVLRTEQLLRRTRSAKLPKSVA